MEKQQILVIYLIEEYIKGRREFSQIELSQNSIFKISLGMVNKLIKKLSEMGIVEIRNKGFLIRDIRKLISFLCVNRSLNKDIIEKFYIDLPVKEIENSMPSDVTYTAYTAYRLLFKESPADYSEIYVYSDKSIRNRFSNVINKKISKERANVFALKKDFKMEKISPIILIYADLWNLKEWYSKEFLESLKKKLWNGKFKNLKI